MTTYHYLTTQITPKQLHDMAKGGIIPARMLQYMEIYKYHIENGSCRRKTCEYFGLPSPTIGYALQQMKRTI